MADFDNFRQQIINSINRIQLERGDYNQIILDSENILMKN
ncbi:unnamed protein product [Paramecium primaurelia]|uniref:Uncharacterized protein n=1 Tax=Paramecium primaurelia TaxID=5886 RepID=A0A8S1NW17_PARPR|nr:unnamed protein product [Paramecium primaurelia]